MCLLMLTVLNWLQYPHQLCNALGLDCCACWNMYMHCVSFTSYLVDGNACGIADSSMCLYHNDDSAFTIML